MRNLKRALSLALAAIMVLGLMVVGASAASTYDNFTDKDEIVNTEAVNTMVSLGVFEGKDDGSYFDPNGIVTRGEMAKIIAVCLNGGKDPVLGDSTNIPKFSDVPASHWAYNYIAYCVQQGIIAGRGDGTFDPGAAVTGSEAAKMFLCALGYRADLEGLLGNEWELNTNVLANQDAKLYAGLTGINPSQGLSRDNTAQMAYNAVQAQEVYYDNLQGDYTGVLQTFTKGTMLANRFKVVKVEGVVVANEVYGINGNGKTVAGKTRLADTNTYTDSNGNTQNYNGTYNISMGNDLMGRRVVIYVQFQNALAPNAESATVLGEPILSNKNTVASTSDRLKDTDAVEDFLDENGLSIGTADALNGVYHATKDGVERVSTTANNATTYNAPSLAAGLNAANPSNGAAGRLMTFIDHDGDGAVDFIFTELKQLGRVSAYNEDKSEITLSNVGTQKFANVVGVENVAKGDIVLYVKYGNTYYVELAETVEGAVSSYASGTVTSVDIDGTSYKASQVGFDSSTGLNDHANGSGMSSMVGNSYTLYLDNYGNGIAWKETELSDSNLALIMGSGVTLDALGNPKGEVKLMLADGTTATYTVDLLASANRYNIVSSDVNTNSEKEIWMAAALAAGTSTANGFADGNTFATLVPSPSTTKNGLRNSLVAVTIDGTTATLGEPSKVNSNYGVASNVAGDSFGKVNINRATSKYTFTTGGDVVVNDSTLFFFYDAADSSKASGVALGLSKLPTTSITATGSTMSAIYTTQANGTKVAKAVFCNGAYRTSYDYAYVTGSYKETKLANGESVYTYPVVLETGEVSTLATKLPGTYTDTVVRYEPDSTAGYYKFTASNGATFSTSSDGSEIKNGFVVTSTDGLAIHVMRGISGVVDSFTATSDMKVWNVEDTSGKTTASEDTLGIGSSVCLVLDNEGYVKTAFVNDSDLEFSTVKNNTGVSLDVRTNPDNLSATTTIAAGGTMKAAGGYSIQILNLTLGNYVNYTAVPVDGGETVTGYAQVKTVNGVAVASITMPDVESIVTLTSVSAAPSGGSGSGSSTELTATSNLDDINTALQGSATEYTIPSTYTAIAGTNNSRLVVPAGKKLTIEGDYIANGIDNIQGTLIVKGTYTVKGAATVPLSGTITANSIALDSSGSTPVTGVSITSGTVNVTNAVTATDLGKGDITVGTGGKLIVGTVAANGTVTPANLTLASGENLTVSGTGSIVAGAVQVQGAGTIAIKGTGSNTLGAVTSATGAIEISSTAANTAASITSTSGNVTLAGNTTVSGAVNAGSGAVAITGGTVKTGAVTSTGSGLTVSGGTATVADVSDGAVAISNGKLILGTSETALADITSTDGITLSGGELLAGDVSAGNLVLSAAATATVSNLSFDKTITNHADGTINVTGDFTDSSSSGATISTGTWYFKGNYTTNGTNATTIGAATTVYFDGGITFGAENMLKSTDATSIIHIKTGTTAVTDGSETLFTSDGSTAIAGTSIAGQSFKGTGSGNKWEPNT